ncbi:13 kDa deflagellation-inducible protein-like [Anoplophora glabripennis]|uniref:13 kDa deflagellation-inducible protein-like n=1 Tax=Anoplophora glabripennis TaxID=217634 RepID=UPI000874F8F1|nr:13 kDa deflagellation-inducible protein-like [Anoplophora glabripennis]
MRNKMTEHGAALQTYNQELVKCLEDLKFKRNEIVDVIYKEEAEKVILEKKIEALQNRLTLLNKSLEHHKYMYESYDKTIKETEDGFKKILESSQALLHLAQHEANKLDCNTNSKKEIIPQYNNSNVYDAIY